MSTMFNFEVKFCTDGKVYYYYITTDKDQDQIYQSEKFTIGQDAIENAQAFLKETGLFQHITNFNTYGLTGTVTLHQAGMC